MSWTALGAVVFWGFSFIATKFALKEVHPFTLLFLRYAIGALLLLLVQYGRDRGLLKIFSCRDWVQIFLLALVGVSGLGLLQAYGLLYTTAINTGWIVAINPILIILAARLLLGEVITIRKISGIFLGFCGVFLIISKGVISLSLFHSPSIVGDLLVLTSALAWTTFTVIGKSFASRFTPLSTSTAIMLSAAVITLPLIILKGEWNKILSLSSPAWMSVFFLGVFCSGLAYLFWYSALEKKDSSVVGMYLYLEPIVTLVGACLLLREEIHWTILLGGGMILIGVYLASKRS
ncbi:MAG: DMT family transporter [Thermodesulfobacteriota bacterium]